MSDGAQDEPINVLRASRKEISKLRRKLEDEYERVQALNDDDFDDEFIEVDTLRFNFGKQIIRHVNLARQIAADYPDSAEFVLGRVANWIAKCRDAWNKTKYFGKEAGYGRVDIPSTADIVRPSGNYASGEKRPRAEISLSTTVMGPGVGAAAPRASSTPEPVDVDVVETATSDAVFSVPTIPQRRQRPTTPTASSSAGLAALSGQQ